MNLSETTTHEYAEQLHLVFEVAAGLLINGVSSDDFLLWAKQSIPVLAPCLFDEVKVDDEPRFAYWIGVQLWNDAPQPAAHFKQIHLDKPGRNQSCPCGSGKKFKQCCMGMPKVDYFPQFLYWASYVDALPKKRLLQLAAENQFPLEAMAHFANWFFDDGQFDVTIKLLDPLFAGKARKVNYKHAELLDVLLDSYDMHYKTSRRKNDLLSRMTEHTDRVIRAGAWQRLASIQHDAGKQSVAMLSLQKAMQADPDNPNHSLLELTMLVSDAQIEQARNRAAFWLKRLLPYEDDYPGLIEILETATSDPEKALLLRYGEMTQDDRVSRLLNIVESVHDFIPGFHFEAFIEDDTDAEDEDGEIPFESMSNAGMLLVNADIQPLEKQWKKIVTQGKPFSVQQRVPEMQEIWMDSGNHEWVDFLQQNPAAFSSLDILDDLAMILQEYIHTPSGMGLIAVLEPLFLQVIESVAQILPEHKKIPWGLTENRPAIRILVHLISLAYEEQDEQYYQGWMQLYLQFNPYDNHGFRFVLINLYLQNDENEAALELIGQYVDDYMPESGFGKALACYRLGKAKDAVDAAHKAIAEFPLVADYLLKARVSKPQFSENGITMDGENLAWIYRQDMRDEWKRTAGALEFLRKIIRK